MLVYKPEKFAILVSNVVNIIRTFWLLTLNFLQNNEVFETFVNNFPVSFMTMNIYNNENCIVKINQ